MRPKDRRRGFADDPRKRTLRQHVREEVALGARLTNVVARRQFWQLEQNEPQAGIILSDGADTGPRGSGERFLAALPRNRASFRLQKRPGRRHSPAAQEAVAGRLGSCFQPALRSRQGQ